MMIMMMMMMMMMMMIMTTTMTTTRVSSVLLLCAGACSGLNPLGQLFGQAKAAPLTNQEVREKYGVQLPTYDVVFEGKGYECRRYQPMSLSECEYTARPEGYELLGGYQAGGENALDLKMPPTSPALILPFDSPKKMRFVLPHPHTPLDATKTLVPPPRPTCDAVRTLSLDPFCVAVVKFSGYATPDVCDTERQELARALAADSIPLAEGAVQRAVLAQYNELYALPWNRDNEIWLKLADEAFAS